VTALEGAMHHLDKVMQERDALRAEVERLRAVVAHKDEVAHLVDARAEQMTALARVLAQRLEYNVDDGMHLCCEQHPTHGADLYDKPKECVDHAALREAREAGVI